MLPCRRDDIAGISSDVFARAMDCERQERFARAVALCVRDFVRDQGRAPRVLVLGSEAGDLCEAAIQAGAEFVVGVESNVDLRTSTESALRASGHTTFELRANMDDVAQDFDVGVCNLSDAVYLAPLHIAQYVRRFDARAYVVPQRVEQFVRDVTFEGLTLDASAMRRGCFDTAIPKAYGTTPQLFSTSEIPIHLHDFPHTSTLPRLRLYAWEADPPSQACEGGCDVKTAGGVTLDSVYVSNETFLVFEWISQLWDGVALENTLESIASLPSRECVYRVHGCGVAMARLNRRSWSSSMRLEWTYSSRGMGISVVRNKENKKATPKTKR